MWDLGYGLLELCWESYEFLEEFDEFVSFIEFCELFFNIKKIGCFFVNLCMNYDGNFFEDDD